MRKPVLEALVKIRPVFGDAGEGRRFQVCAICPAIEGATGGLGLIGLCPVDRERAAIPRPFRARAVAYHELTERHRPLVNQAECDFWGGRGRHAGQIIFDFVSRGLQSESRSLPAEVVGQQALFPSGDYIRSDAPLTLEIHDVLIRTTGCGDRMRSVLVDSPGASRPRCVARERGNPQGYAQCTFRHRHDRRRRPAILWNPAPSGSSVTRP